MSRMRISAKVRKNADYLAVTAYLDSLGIEWTLQPATGKGHPFIQIDRPNFAPFRFHLATTPKGWTKPSRVIGKLKKRMQNAGFDL